jgi:hypothetical protein
LTNLEAVAESSKEAVHVQNGGSFTPASAGLSWRASTSAFSRHCATEPHHLTSTKMVCAKCAKLSKSTTLATPGVKKKSEMYYGSPAGSSKTSDKTKTSATLGNNGIGKVTCHCTTCLIYSLTILQSKLLSKAARNPYASYSSSCTTCKTKVDQGRTYCQKCAYKANGT